MSTHGIPTVLRARRYRSRLEAKWAAFFDLLGWASEYEPLDCDGWIPDFALTTKTGFTLVEVKPVTLPGPEIFEKIDGAISNRYEVLVVGLAPFVARQKFAGSAAIGWIRERDASCWRECMFHRAAQADRFDFFPAALLPRYRISGRRGRRAASFGDIDRVWATACNAVQWKGESAEL